MPVRFIFGNKAKQSALTGGASTNLLVYSHTFSQTQWAKTGVTVSTVSDAAPGSQQAYAITEGVNSAAPALDQYLSVFVSSGTYTGSVYVKSMAGSAIRYALLQLSGSVYSSTNPYLIVDLATGAITAKSVAGTVRVRDVGNGWWRLAVTGVAGASGLGALRVRMSNNSASGSAYTGDGSSGILAWGAQLEAGAVATAVVPTAAAAAAGSGWLTAMPVTNLQAEGRARKARSAGAVGGAVVLGNFELLNTVISGAALHGHNLSDYGWWTLELFSGANQTGTLLYSSGEIFASSLGGVKTYLSCLWIGQKLTAGSFRVTVSDPQNTAGYVQAGRLVLGDVFAPTWSVEYGAQLSWQDASTQRRTQGGSLRTNALAGFRRLSFELGLLNEAERAVLFAELVSVGLRNEILVSCFPGEGGAKEADYAFLAKCTTPSAQTMASPGIYSCPLTLDEV